MATKKRIASGKKTRPRRTQKVAMAATTGAAAAVATVQQTQGHLQIASTSSAGTPGAKDEREVVVIRWDGEQPLSLKGWQVRDKRADHAYTFGDVTLQPHSTIRVHSGGRAAQDSETDVHWVRAKDVWNRESDVVHLLDSRGVMHAQYIFEAATGRKTTKRKRKLPSSRKVAAKKKVAAKQPTTRKPAVRKATAKKKPVKKKPVKTKPVKKKPVKKKRAAMASASRAQKASVKKRTTRQRAAKRITVGKLRIVSKACRFVGPKNDPEQEVVAIAWDGPGPLSLKGWKVYDSGAKHTYTFGDITLQAKSTLRLHTGGRDEVDTATDVYWRQRNGVWNNEGDVVTVAEPDGKVSATYAYRGGGAAAPKKKKTVAAKKKPKASPTPKQPRRRPATTPKPQPVTIERVTQPPAGEKPEPESKVVSEQPKPPAEKPSVAKKTAPKTARAKKKTSKVARAKPAEAAKPSRVKKTEAPQSPPSANPKPKPAAVAKPQTEPSSERERPAPKTTPKEEKTPRDSTPKQPPREPSSAAAQLSPSSQPDQQRQPARQSQASEPNQPSGPNQPGAPSGAEPPSVPPSQGSPNDWKFTKPVMLMVIAAFLGGVAITSIIAMSTHSDTEVSLSEESLAEIASSQERAVQALVKRFTVEGTQKAIVAKAAIERRPPSASAAIDAAIAAARRAKESRCSEASHAQQTADIDRAIAATKRAIVILSDDEDD